MTWMYSRDVSDDLGNTSLIQLVFRRCPLTSKFWSSVQSYCRITALLSLLACRASSNDKNECGKETQQQHFTTAVFHAALSLPGQQCYLNGQVWGWAFFCMHLLFLITNSLWVVLICEQINTNISKLLKWPLYYAKHEPDQNSISGAFPTPGLDQYKQNSPWLEA